MTCQRYDANLVSYVDREVPDELRLEIDEHLKSCRRCREIVRDLQMTRGVLTQWQPARPSDDFAEKVGRGIRDETRDVRREMRSRTHVTETEGRQVASRTVVTRKALRARRLTTGGKLALAAVMLLAVGLGVLVWGPELTGGGRGAEITVGQVRQLAASADSAELRQLAVAVDALTAQEIRQRRPEPARVIATETVQTFMDLAVNDGHVRQIGILLSQTRDRSGLLSRAPVDRALSELALWTGGGWGSKCYAQVPDKAAEHLVEGMSLERQGKYDEAMKAYDRVQGGTHEMTLALVRKAGILMKLGRTDEAQQAIEEAKMLGRRSRFEQQFLDRMRLRARSAVKLAQAAGELQQKLERNPDDASVARELADTQLAAGNFAGAATTLDTLAAGAAKTEQPMLRFRAAWCRKNAGDFKQAFDEFQSILSGGSAEKEVRALCMFERADILERCQRYAQAIDVQTLLVGYPGYLDDDSRALVILRIGYTQLYLQNDLVAAKTTLARLGDPSYADTTAAQVARLMLADQPQ